jgi:hypothetical protein
MNTTIKIAHPVLVLILIAGYSFLIYRLYKKKNQDMQPFEVMVAQVVRIAFLLVYFSGLVLSVNFRLPVSRVHHYASLVPVVILAVFQFLPFIRKKNVQTTEYFYFFIYLLIAVLVISVTARIF